MHSKKIVHLDLKPQNIFLSGRSGQGATVKVLDFGIAKGINEPGTEEAAGYERLTETGLVCGTPQFMAPEQAEGKRDLTPAVDVYNMACVLFKMLTGRLLYEGETPFDVAYQHVMSPIPPFPPSIEGTEVGGLLQRALAKEPGRRLPNASAFLRDLQEVLKASGIELRPPTMPAGLADPEPELPPPVAAKPASKAPSKRAVFALLALGAGGLLLLLAAAAFWFFALR